MGTNGSIEEGTPAVRIGAPDDNAAATPRADTAGNPGLDPSRLKEGQVIKIPAAIATVHKELPDQTAAVGSGVVKKTVKDKEKDKDVSEGAPVSETKPVFGPK